MASKHRTVRIQDDLDEYLVALGKKRGNYSSALDKVLRVGVKELKRRENEQVR